MKIVRLYTGTDSKSHFEEVELNFGGNQPMLTTDSRPATSTVFRCAPAGLVIDRHSAPRRQFLVTLSGSWEIEASNGVKRTFKTGPAVLDPKASCPVLTPPIARPDIQIRGPRIFPDVVPSFCARVQGPSW